ncbi:mechanosensitive ion channel domain-containing protein [Muribaculum sp.]|uniref:mechanosensitive ion channel family protein n=1 Tax=Muribaculum sp. TaxID=1918611 RepID=UPI0023C08652|nr:mechanosensitive ion channel domain-containing protein [Muribaculum sp.]MDE5705421.1 mechanosensitive ion channel family protein [Muribaculum sp.]
MSESIKEIVGTIAPETLHPHLATVLLLTGIAIISVIAYFVTKGVLMMFEKMILRSPTEWDDDMLNPRLMRAVSQLAPALVISWLLPQTFADSPGSVKWIDVVTSLYILWAIVRIVVIIIDNLYKALLRRDNLKAYAITGIFQMFKLIMIGIGVIIAISILIGKTPIAILTALGASAAVLSLVFKDTILGLVAGIQLTANKMLQRGDWITMPNRDLNGEVIDVSLTTVKVRNWDNSVTTVPPYSLITDSFRNYRPMQISGGRRVDRSIYIDINTVRLVSEEELTRLFDDGMIPDFGGDDVRNRRGGNVNLRLLRDYLEWYLRSLPDVNTDMTLMVRQMAPTQSGLPIQLYFFIRETAWVKYEHIQADIFDYVYAVVRKFGLSIFQAPAGTDLLGRGLINS